MSAPLLLAPHNDDEALWASFLCLRHRPHVIVVLRSEKQARDGVTAGQREAETDAAMSLLGCSWEQWSSTDLRPDWPLITEMLAEFADAPKVFAPAFELAGHHQHNKIAALADHVFGTDRVAHYLTYTRHGKSDWGEPIPYEAGWVALKLRALLCYESQIARADQVEHFLRAHHEYVT